MCTESKCQKVVLCSAEPTHPHSRTSPIATSLSSIVETPSLAVSVALVANGMLLSVAIQFPSADAVVDACHAKPFDALLTIETFTWAPAVAPEPHTFVCASRCKTIPSEKRGAWKLKPAAGVGGCGFGVGSGLGGVGAGGGVGARGDGWDAGVGCRWIKPLVQSDFGAV